MLQIQHLTLIHRKDLRVLIHDFSLVLNRGDKAVLIGEEGNGKSSLLKWAADPALIDDYMEAEGIRSTQGERLGYLPQELPAEDKNRSVYEFMCQSDAFCRATPATLSERAHEWGIPLGLLYSEQRMGTLSGGEKVKIQMIRLLLDEPDILLLDEPSNDIDLETLEWMEGLIRDYDGGILYISHDETLIERTANRVILLEQLRHKQMCRHTVANIPFRQFMQERQEAFEKQAQQAYSERREEKNALERFRRIQQRVEHEQNTISRQDPSGGRLLKKKMASVKALERRYAREHEEMTEYPEMEGAIFQTFARQQTIPAGRMVLDLHLRELSRYPGDPEPIPVDFTLSMRGPEKVCIIGPNGTGKTTLLRHIYALLRENSDLKAAYMPQDYAEALDPDISPVEYLAPSGRKEEITEVRTRLGALKYTHDEMLHPIRELSGGQKAKLLLLGLCLSDANVLILDEPTRNFSPLSGPQIRRLLKSFGGAIISVSHDRKYMSEVADRVVPLARL